MNRVLAVALLSSISLMTAPAFGAGQAAQAGLAFPYPQTRTVDLVEDHFGVKVADPYRWLENDVRNDPEVANWVAAENKVTDAFLQTLPLRDWLLFRSLSTRFAFTCRPLHWLLFVFTR